MILLNESGKRAGDVGVLRNVYSLGSFDPHQEYKIDVATLDGSQTGLLRMPVRSVGKAGLRYYFAADMMFLNHHGFDTVFPEPPLQLQAVVVPVPGGFRGSLVYGDQVIFKTPQFLPSANAALEGLAVWAKTAPVKWVMPEAVKALVKKDAVEA